MCNKHFLLMIACAALVGCATPAADKTDEAATPVEDRSGNAGEGRPDEGRTYGLDGEPGLSRSELGTTGGGQDGQDPLNQRSIYFEFNSDVIPVEYRRIVEAHAQFLQKNTSAQLSLEGHADERGTREYNLALGERRARAVKQMMTLIGLDSQRIHTVSYGEERPYAASHDESSWYLNRRVDIVY